MKRVLLFGTFDIVHKGHLDFIRQAKQYGDYLIAIVARDRNVLKIKGKMPLQDEDARKKELERFGLFDEIILGSLGNPYEAVAEVNPDIICLGYDQKTYTDSLSEELGKKGMHPKIVRLEPYMPHKYKSSIINNR